MKKRYHLLLGGIASSGLLLFLLEAAPRIGKP